MMDKLLRKGCAATPLRVPARRGASAGQPGKLVEREAVCPNHRCCCANVGRAGGSNPASTPTQRAALAPLPDLELLINLAVVPALFPEQLEERREGPQHPQRDQDQRDDQRPTSLIRPAPQRRPRRR